MYFLSFGGLKSKIKMLAGLVPEASLLERLPPLTMAASLPCPHVAYSPCTCISGALGTIATTQKQLKCAGQTDGYRKDGAHIHNAVLPRHKEG